LKSKFSSFVNRGNFAKKLDSVILYSDVNNPIKANDQNHHTEYTKGKAKKRPKEAPPARTEEGRELILLV
jgi:hypothetical protein